MKKNGLLQRILNLFASRDDQPTPTEPPAPTEPQAPAQKTETHKVAGVSFRRESFEALAVKNEDYSKTRRELIAEGVTDCWIYEYDFLPGKVELIPEPENPQDPKAIKVVVKGQHIGYIKSGSCTHIHKLLRNGKILSLRCEIGGGRSKIVREDIDDFGKSKYTVEQEDRPYYAQLSIVVEL